MPLLAVYLAAAWRIFGARGLPPGRRAALLGLRAGAVLLLIALAARPVSVRDNERDKRDSVGLLIDRSESMALVEGGATRYQRALDFTRNRLLPALKREHLAVDAYLFADDAAPADGEAVADAKADGKRTDLARAIVRAAGDAPKPPLALIALSDGIANDTVNNSRGLAALIERSIPFIGIGYGRKEGVTTLSLQRADAPPVAPPKQKFSVTAQLTAAGGSGEAPGFNLALLRDGQLVQTKQIAAFQGPRFWTENFEVTEPEEGKHDYTVELLPPARSDLVSANRLSTVNVLISPEKEFRVLFVQGALTWDFKFIARAMRDDPTLQLTGLSRTSDHSVFRQNVESAGELLDGFPTTVEAMAAFRVVILSNLTPADLSAPQQDILARFCHELGGGVLMIGGPGTFNTAWRGTRLEQLLPVVFAGEGGVTGLDRPFHLRPTAAAFQQAAFRIADTEAACRAAWDRLPAFSQYGRVNAAKPGAVVWAEHEKDSGPGGARRILMASQHYGAGCTAVICVQNFWRWRLAKESDPTQFDRFWRQFLRYLGEAGRQAVDIAFLEQDLRPDTDVRFTVEKQSAPTDAAAPAADAAGDYLVQVRGPGGTAILDQKMPLTALRLESLQFHSAGEGLYQVSVQDHLGRALATRAIEVRASNLEFERTGRDMENLQQWASATHGLAVEEERCDDAAVLNRILECVRQARESLRLREPAGLNGWVLSLLLGCAAGEWLLRRRWRLR